jgi:hypothetical protein
MLHDHGERFSSGCFLATRSRGRRRESRDENPKRRDAFIQTDVIDRQRR